MSGASDEPKRKPSPDPRMFWRNLRAPIPLGQKLRLILRNNWLKLRLRQSCCGNLGQPGC
ncbi:MAG: hypothetical protein Q8P22_05495 [Chloroflexota bacterium]|nr:hypothetical protein [Chloroflexota bacterium]